MLMAIHLCAESANLLQILIKGGVVLCPSKPAHDGVLQGQLDRHKRARVQLLPEQNAKLLQGNLASRRRNLEVGRAHEQRREWAAGVLAHSNQTG